MNTGERKENKFGHLAHRQTETSSKVGGFEKNIVVEINHSGLKKKIHTLPIDSLKLIKSEGIRIGI